MFDAPDPKRLLTLARLRMPYGRYAGRLLVDLPEPYVLWFHKIGYPSGQLGSLLRDLYEIKANGLEWLLEPFKEGATADSVRFAAHPDNPTPRRGRGA